MIPSEYKLPFVVARLIERLEGTRRSFGGDEDDKAAEAFARISEEHLEAAMGEFREVALANGPDAHVDFVQTELRTTFLPRYTRLALKANVAEASGHGLGVMGGVFGRVCFGLLVVLMLWIGARLPVLKWIPVPYLSAYLLPFLLAIPFLPDILGWLHRRKHRAALTAIVADMDLIQERSEDYEPVSRLSIEDIDEAEPLRNRPQKELS
jgi:hypothetical protein